MKTTIDTNAKIVERIQAGDTDGYQELWEANRGLLAHFALRYLPIIKQRNAIDIDDLIQAGYIGMHKAATKYDFGRGAKFSTYSAYFIKREIERALTIAVGYKRDPADMAYSLDAPLDPHGDFNRALNNNVADVLPSPSEQVETEWLRDNVRGAVLRIASDNIRCAVWERYWNGETNEQIAFKYGLSKNDISVRLKKGIFLLLNDHVLKKCAGDYGYCS